MGRLDNRAQGSGCSSLAWALQLGCPLRVPISSAAGHGDVSQTRTCTQELSPTASLPPSPSLQHHEPCTQAPPVSATGRHSPSTSTQV